MVLTTGNDVKPPDTPLVATRKQLEPQKGFARCYLPGKYSICLVVCVIKLPVKQLLEDTELLPDPDSDDV